MLGLEKIVKNIGNKTKAACSTAGKTAGKIALGLALPLLLSFSLKASPLNIENKLDDYSQIKKQSEVIKTNKQSETQTNFIKLYNTKSRTNRFDVLVARTFYDSVSIALPQYISDLEAEGFSVSLYNVRADSISYDSLRSFLRREYLQDTIKGATLIGQFQYPTMQLIALGSPNQIFEFPITTFYEDIDGIWLDSLMVSGNNLVPGQDGKLDTHRGNKNCEIYLGIIDPTRLTFGNATWGTSGKRARDYFTKLHNYRQGTLTRKDSALVYLDDDAFPYTDTCNTLIHLVYPNAQIISDSNATTAQDYRSRLTRGYEYIWLAAHSGTSFHQFKENNGTQTNSVWNTELPEINPQTLFYFLNCCYSAKITANNNIASHYIFSSNKGLGVTGFTSEAGINQGEKSEFFAQLATKSFGESMKSWKSVRITSYQTPYYNDAYNMIHLGDPTLKPRRQGLGIEEQVFKPINDKRIKIYPTIFKDKVILSYNDSKEELERLDLYSGDGRKVKSLNLPDYTRNNKINLDLSDLNKGVYFVKVNQNRDVEKIIKQ